MKKTWKKIITGALAVLMSMSALALTGCDPEDDIDEVEKIDPNKTQLYVGILDGGMGDEWMKKLKTRFEAEYADYQGVDGKVGVQVIIDKQKEPFRGTTLINNITNNRQDVYFTEQIYYDQWVRKDLMLDVTDVVEGDLSIFGENVTIASKMDEADKEYLERDGKYYALPFYTSFMAISYDVDLFDSYGLYFDDDGEFIGTVTGENGVPVPDLSQKSAGQDGIKGTYDDGLPITYEQFFKLCDEMNKMNITPIHWSGEYQKYVTQYMQQLMADYEGSEQYALNFTPNSGTLTNYVIAESLTGNIGDVKVKDYVLTDTSDEDGTIFRQAGRYYALKFCETLVKNNYSNALSFSPSESFLTAQESFLYSSYLSQGSSKKAIGMFIDGTWWYNEASQIFADMQDTYPNSGATERRIGIMPCPKVSEEDAGNNSLLVTNDTLVFINKSIDSNKIDLAKDFIRFATTDVSLKEFTMTTNLLRTYNYALTDEELAELPYFGQSYYAYVQSAQLIYPRANNTYYMENVDVNLWFESTVNGNTYKTPTQAFKDDASLTAEQYFLGLHG